MEILQKITEEQSEQIGDLIEKRYALQNLKNILEKKADEEIYQRCVKELELVQKLYDEWWDSMGEQYGLQKRIERETLYVDVPKHMIYGDSVI